MVKVNNLGVKFGNFWAVKNVSFEVKAGEIFGFLGANGAGKTTTIRVLCGLLSPSTGEAYIDNKNVLTDTAKIKSLVGYMSQRFTLYDDLTVKENIDFAASIRKLKPKDLVEQLNWIQSFVPINNHFEKMVKDLPGGIKQQVSLCTSLLHNPKVIFLDEPTAGVTPSARSHFWQLIKSLAQTGKTIFVTTHYMDEAEQCDRIALMKDGELIACDSPKDLKVKTFTLPILEISPYHNLSKEELSSIKNQNDVLRIDPYGLRYHLFLKSQNEFSSLLEIIKPLGQTKIIQPTLEDVFIHRVEEQK